MTPTPTRGAALVTGGATGLGAATARLLAGRGWDVTVTVHRTDAPRNLPARVEPCDLGDLPTVDALVDRLEPTPRLVVLAAARFHRRPLPRSTSLEVHRDLAVNLTGGLHLLRRLLDREDPALARIVFVGSAGALHGASGLTGYGSQKAALHGTTAALARELAGRQTTVNLVEPGPMVTELAQRRAAAWTADAEAFPATPVTADPSMVAEVIAFLAGDGAANISGAVLRVDGGLLAAAAP